MLLVHSKWRKSEKSYINNKNKLAPGKENRRCPSKMKIVWKQPENWLKKKKKAKCGNKDTWWDKIFTNRLYIINVVVKIPLSNVDSKLKERMNVLQRKTNLREIKGIKNHYQKLLHNRCPWFMKYHKLSEGRPLNLYEMEETIYQSVATLTV